MLLSWIECNVQSHSLQLTSRECFLKLYFSTAFSARKDIFSKHAPYLTNEDLSRLAAFDGLTGRDIASIAEDSIFQYINH